MPRGGARPNSGPKKDSTGKALNPYRRQAAADAPPAAASVPAQPRGTIFSFEAAFAFLQAMKDRDAALRDRARTPELNPYTIRPELFGPVQAHIKKNRPRLAMDQNGDLIAANGVCSQAWMVAGGGGLATEGLLFLGYPYLSELAQRAEYRIFGEIRAEEMTRKWIRFRGTDDGSHKDSRKKTKRNRDDDAADRRRQARDERPRSDRNNYEIEDRIKELNDLHEQLRVKSVFKQAFAQDGFFGISHLMIDIKGSEASDVRNPELSKSIGNGRDRATKAKFGGNPGFLKGFRTIEPIWCYPTVYNASNPLADSWYVPQVWYVMGTEIHRTRLLPMIGRPVPDILKPAYAFGGLAQTQMAEPYVNIWLKTRASVGEIIHAFSVMVLATDLATTTMPGGSGGGNGDVLARMMMAVWMRDNQGMQVIDKNKEDYKNVSAPLGGLEGLQAQSQEHMATVARIPLVKAFGIQPMGLNATSEGELRAFEETIAGQQEHFRGDVTTVCDLTQYHLWGARDPDITYDFVELREETPKEQADIQKLKAETSQILIDSGQLSQEEGRQRLEKDPDSGYESIDPADVPDLLEEEEEGLEPEGGRPQPQAEVGEEEEAPPAPTGRERRKGK